MARRTVFRVVLVRLPGKIKGSSPAGDGEQRVDKPEAVERINEKFGGSNVCFSMSWMSLTRSVEEIVVSRLGRQW